MSIRPLMSAERKTSRRGIGRGLRLERGVDVTEGLQGEDRRPERSISQNWKHLEIAACVFGREKIPATFVNADVSRRSQGRLTIQKRQIARASVDRIRCLL